MPSSKTQDYVVEKIISKRSDKKGQTRYLIKWKGYPSSENTWEPETHVANCQDLVNEFEAEQNIKDTSERRTSKRSTRTSDRTSSARKRQSSSESKSTDETGSIKTKFNGKRLRKSTMDAATSSSIDSDDSNALDIDKLEEIVDARRNEKLDTVEYYVQLKKMKKPIWIHSNRLTEDYTQEMIDFLEDKYV